MGKQWARQEVKHDVMAQSVGRAVSWANKNQQTTLGALAGAVAVLVFGAYVLHQYLKNRETAWERLAFAESYAYQGQPDKAVEQIRTLEAEFSQAPASGFGTLFAGDILYRQGRFKDAADAYRRLLDRGKPQSALPFAMASLAAAQEAAGDCPSAIKAADDFLREHQDHYLAPQVHSTMARCQEALGQRDAAKQTYERMAVLYPESYWAQWAKSRSK